MHVFEMVVLVVAIGVIGGIISSYLDRNKVSGSEKTINDLIAQSLSGMGFDEGSADKSTVNLQQKKINAMEERIQVLERIVTDKGTSLKAEINSLK